jgi:hypothetical protein
MLGDDDWLMPRLVAQRAKGLLEFARRNFGVPVCTMREG